MARQFAVVNKLRRAWALGLEDSVGWVAVKAEARLWNGFFGVDTARPFDAGAYEGLGESRPYEPLPWPLLRRSIDALRLKADDVFLDYGAGMGRALLMAARHPVRRVVGVELLAPLAAIARDNVARARGRLRSMVEVVTGDATAWEVPDDVTVAYLFNPFVGEVMACVQGRLAASLQRAPRRFRLLYAHAGNQPNLFEGVSWLKPSATIGAGVFRGFNLRLYSN